MIASGVNWGGPRNGPQDDKAHPPIHPVKVANKNVVSNQEWAIYDLICKHFLGSISKDAVGAETQIKIDVGGEIFNC